MKKRIVIVLLLLIYFMPLMVFAEQHYIVCPEGENCPEYQDSAIEKISDINKVPSNVVANRKRVYITNMSNPQVTLHNEMLEFLTRDNTPNVVYVVMTNFPTTKPENDMTFSNLMTLYYDKIGYYIDDNGKAVYVDVRINMDSAKIHFGNDYENPNNYQYSISTIGKTSFSVSSAFTDGVESFTPKVGSDYVLSFKILNDDGSELSSALKNKLFLQWKFSDIDGKDSSGENPADLNSPYRESINFLSGFVNKYYVQNDTVLTTNENNTKFASSSGTNGNGEESRSSVVAFQITDSVKVEWLGSNCGTGIASISSYYPDMEKPTKAIVGKDYYKAKENIQYTIKHNFPYTVAANAASKIEFVDTFDTGLDIKNMTVEVYDSSSKNVTNDWTKTVNGQTVTLTYNKTTTTKVSGNYTFNFKKIALTTTSGKCSQNTNLCVTENESTYKKISNTATIKVTSKSGDVISLNTNEVVIKVKSDLNLKKEIAEFNDLSVKVGDKIVYKYTIINNGSTALKNVKLKDQLEGVTFRTPVKDTLEPGEVIEVYGEYTLKKEDLKDWTRITNNKTATVTGKDSSETLYSDTDAAAPSIEIIHIEDTAANDKMYLYFLGGTLILMGFCMFFIKESKKN